MKIMFVMLRTMGDVILGTTICRELKHEFPGCEIHFYVNKTYGSLLQNNPYIDVVKEMDTVFVDPVFMEMTTQEFDRIYAPYQARGECNMWHQQEATRHQHLVDFYWMRMGFHRKIEDRECYLFPNEEDFKEAESKISFDVPRIAIHTTSGVETKDWKKFDELVEEFRKNGYGVIQVGGSQDVLAKGAIDLRDKLSFMQLAALLSKCAVFIGLDSGISYMADAMKTPTIVIQGSTDPVTSGPISKRVIHLFAKETGYADCQIVRCHVNCRHEVNCNTRITPGMVMAEAEKILNNWTAPVPVHVD